MAKPKAIKSVETKPDAPETPEPTKNSVVVKFETGTRVYSLEKHGENFQELAEEFVSKNPGARKIVK